MEAGELRHSNNKSEQKDTASESQKKPKNAERGCKTKK